MAHATIMNPGFDSGSQTTQRLYRGSNEFLAPCEIGGNRYLRRPDLTTAAPVQIIRKTTADALRTLFDDIRSWPETSRERPPNLQADARIAEFSFFVSRRRAELALFGVGW